MQFDKLKVLMEGVDPNDPTLLSIANFLETKHNPPPKPNPTFSHAPSSFGTPCHRKIYYNYFKVPKDSKVDVYGARIFELGNYVEEMVMSWLIGSGEHIPFTDALGLVPVGWDGKPNPQFPIAIPEWHIPKGFIDNVAYVNGELWLYEIKSMNTWKFGNLEEPLPEHMIQGAAYFKAFNQNCREGNYRAIRGLENATELAGVKFIYLNKDTSEIKLFPVRAARMNQQVDMIQQKVEKMDQFINNKRLPGKTPDKCTYCPWSKKCRKDVNIE